MRRMPLGSLAAAIKLTDWPRSTLAPLAGAMRLMLAGSGVGVSVGAVVGTTAATAAVGMAGILFAVIANGWLPSGSGLRH